MNAHRIALALAALVTTAALGAQEIDRTFVRDKVLDTLSWRPIGPVNMGGRIVDVAVNPQNGAEFYVAAATGGLFKTDNCGTTFKAVFEFEKTVSLGAVALAPSKPDVVYLGTGEANNLRSVYSGRGIFRSSDGGGAWQPAGLDGTDHIARIVVHPTEPDVVWVAAMGPLYSDGEQRGVFKSKDGGKTWAKTLYVNERVGATDLAIDPGNPDVLFAATYECRRRAWNFTEGGPGSGVYKSTDGGEKWQKLGGGLPDGDLGRIGLAVFPGDGNVVYALVENRNAAAPRSERAAAEPAETEAEAKDPDVKDERREAEDGGGRREGDHDPAPAYDDRRWDEHAWSEAATAPAAAAAPPSRIRGGEVYRSNDGGASWTLVKERLISDRPSHYFYFFGQIRVHPADADRIYVLDVRVHTSNDGGKRWSTRMARGLHGDHHALWIDPSNPRRVLLGNDGGLAQSWDGGETWDHFDHLPLAQYYAIGVDERRPYHIYGGLQDNGSWGVPSSGVDSTGLRREHAFRIGGGDGFYACVDPADPDTIYSESQFGGLYRYDRRSDQRQTIKPRRPRGSPALRWNWMAPVALSPHASRTVYFCSQYVHRSHDRGDTWEVISPDLTTADKDKIAGNVPHCTITTIAESPLRKGQIWAGTDDGKVWVTRTDGDRWIDLDGRFPDLPRGLWVSRVEPSAHDADTAFVAFTGYREDIRKPFLYMTTDCGETFTSIANDLPDEPINVVRQHPRNEHVLFVGTDLGVHASLDDGGTWLPLNADLPTNPVHDLVIHPRDSDLIAGTHGRGLFVMDITPLETLTMEALRAPFVGFRPRDGYLLPAGRSSGDTGAGVRGWSADNQETRPVFWVYLREDVAEPVRLVVRNAAGRELFSRTSIDTAGLHRIPWRTARARGGRGGGRRGGDDVAAGDFAVEISHGDAKEVYRFRVFPAR